MEELASHRERKQQNRKFKIKKWQDVYHRMGWWDMFQRVQTSYAAAIKPKCDTQNRHLASVNMSKEKFQVEYTASLAPLLWDPGSPLTTPQSLTSCDQPLSCISLFSLFQWHVMKALLKWQDSSWYEHLKDFFLALIISCVSCTLNFSQICFNRLCTTCECQGLMGWKVSQSWYYLINIW